MAKKDDEDALTAAQQRAMRTGRSFFPAANTYRGINLNAAPNPNAITDTGQGETLNVGDSRFGFRALPPYQNPAYQAAIAGGRPARSGYTTIQTPSGGTMSVPISSSDRYSALLNKLPSVPTGFERPNTQTAFALGDTGVVPTGNTPYERSFRMGYEGGAVTRPESAGFGYQAGQALAGLAGVASRGIANLFQPKSTPQQYSSQNFYAYNPSPSPMRPRRYFDY